MVSSITLVISILSLKEEPPKDSYWIDTQYLDVDTTETEDGSDTDDDFDLSASEDGHDGPDDGHDGPADGHDGPDDGHDGPDDGHDGQDGPDDGHHDDSDSGTDEPQAVEPAFATFFQPDGYIRVSDHRVAYLRVIAQRSQGL